MATLSKTDLVEYIFDTIGVNKSEGKLLVEQFFEEIRLSLESGEQVLLSGFGRFHLQDKKERPARNPRTMKDAIVSARRVVKFKPSSVLLQMVQRYLEKEGGGESEGRAE
jgi:integration host factor subunit alpha